LVGRRRWRRSGGFFGVAALLSFGLWSPRASAQTEAESASADTSAEPPAVPPPPVAPVQEPGPKDPSKTTVGAFLGASGSVNHEALAGTLGARLRFSKHWTFGVDGEWNPWIAVNGTTNIRSGAFNGYGTVIWRSPLAYEQFNLRVTANFGISRLLIDLYGAPKGTTGIYAGLSPLGVEWKVSRAFYLVLNPLNFALPVPQLKGVPFSYWQYRFTIGIEMYAG
jgi:hypothetical protein